MSGCSLAFRKKRRARLPRALASLHKIARDITRPARSSHASDLTPRADTNDDRTRIGPLDAHVRSAPPPAERHGGNTCAGLHRRRPRPRRRAGHERTRPPRALRHHLLLKHVQLGLGWRMRRRRPRSLVQLLYLGHRLLRLWHSVDNTAATAQPHSARPHSAQPRSAQPRTAQPRALHLLHKYVQLGLGWRLR
jgi:hypothetical protein